MGSLFDFMLPELKSPMTGASTDALMAFIHIASFIILGGVTIAMIYFAIKYKRRSDDDETPLITHNNKLEVTWSVIPLLLVFVVFGWGYKGWLNLKTVPDNAYEIQVSAYKWGWTFKYDTGAQVGNELHVPAGKPIKMVMQSEDVLHSFFVPDYRIKQDVLPNRYTYVWFQAEEPGESQVFCTEYCGTSHSDMLAKVIVHTKEDFDAWLAEQGSGSGGTPVERGENLISIQGCVTCHSVDGSDKIGPSFQGLWGSERNFESASSVTADENYIRESILDPSAKIVEGFQNQMVSYEGRLSDDDISDIIEYIKTLED
ncbi:MAG: cytochrome c oxidase subunit II [Gracilimonas sp.]|uniref:cytochrome c oxidase subunit II n=1 Tax=Gracilimonas sp. TaxID=1974203 RepID=UPI0019C107F2|nr:cytochrome c oxidase subunit II [Gracilimonas sp.]MBD3615012.1 cytochrome c oxidase subunit II [Gracilimonas sp.]